MRPTFSGGGVVQHAYHGELPARGPQRKSIANSIPVTLFHISEIWTNDRPVECSEIVEPRATSLGSHVCVGREKVAPARVRSEGTIIWRAR